MRFPWLWGLVALLSALCALVLEARAAQSFTGAPSSIQTLDQVLEAERKTRRVPGLSIAVIENGAIALSKGYGMADVAAGKAATAKTLFRVGSVSKMLLGIAAMMLVEEGKLTLDAKLADLVPDLKFENPWEAGDPVRLVHLLEHTSGWADVTVREFARDAKGMSYLDVLKDGRRVSRYRPGTFSSYSNAGYVAAALMVERAAGMPVEEFVRARIFTPLSMASATFQQPAEGLSLSYSAPGSAPVRYAEIGAGLVGALNLPAEELAQIGLLLLGRGTLNGQTLLTPQSVERIETAQSSAAARAGLGGHGLGNLGFPVEKGVLRGHNGGIDGFSAMLRYWPGQNAGFVVISNGGSPEPFAELILAYLSKSVQRPDVAASLPAGPQDERFIGSYRLAAAQNSAGLLTAHLFDVRRFDVRNGKVSFGGMTLEPLGGGIYRRPGWTVGTVAAVDGPDGMALHADGRSFEQVPWRVDVLRILLLAAFGAALAFSLFHAVVWSISAVRGKLARRGGVGLRLLPLFALVSPVALGGLIVAATAGAAPATVIERLGTETPWSLAVFTATLIMPVLGGLSLWRGLTAGFGAPFWLRLYDMAVGALVLTFAYVLWDYGLLGLRLWVE